MQAETYKAGRKTTNVVLEILNLQKKEDVTVDLVSNQDFNEVRSILKVTRFFQLLTCAFHRLGIVLLVTSSKEYQVKTPGLQ